MKLQFTFPTNTILLTIRVIISIVIIIKQDMGYII